MNNEMKDDSNRLYSGYQIAEIREREANGLTRRQKQAAWIIDYLNSLGPNASVGARATYDDGEALCSNFLEAFPGRTPDPNFTVVGNRLSKLLAAMCGRRGPLERWRLSNHDQYHPQQEPNWQYSYALYPGLADKLKRGVTTPEEEARRVRFF